jgi:uncharacterized DUF497 family protein
VKIDGFDWDDGNWPKCAKHGLSKLAIEAALSGAFVMFDDPHDPAVEQRFRAIGKDQEGRSIFVVFCLRDRNGKTLIRPISARFMRQKEVAHYEQQTKA